jgi:hypothetical protein
MIYTLGTLGVAVLLILMAALIHEPLREAGRHDSRKDWE